MAVVNSIFGKSNPYIDANDFSKRLIAFVSQELKSELESQPSQTAIGDRLKVSQPFIHSVLYKGKSFGIEKVRAYCKKIGLEVHELQGELLKISLESSQLAEVAAVKKRPENLVSAVFDSYETLHSKLESERRLTRCSDSGRAFDSYKAYSEIVSFVWEALAMAGESAVCVGVLTRQGGRSHAIWTSEVNGGEHGVSRTLDGDPIQHWILDRCSSLDVKRDCEDGRPHEYRIPIECVPSTAVEQSQLGNWTGGDITLIVRNVCSEVPVKSQSVDNQVDLILLMNSVGSQDSDSDLRSTTSGVRLAISCGAHLVEKVVSCAIEDNIRCMEYMLDSRLEFGEILGSAGRKSDLEVAEFGISNLLNHVCEESPFSERVATCDVWLHYLSAKSFVSPSKEFQRVSTANRSLIVEDGGNEFTLAAAYERELRLGRLVPRPLGKTRHMIAQQRALVMNKRDNWLGSKIWSSSHVLEMGTFIGIPFVFRPTGKKGHSFLSACYVRFIEDLSTEEATEAISEIVWSMLGNPRQKFTPLIRLEDAESKSRPKLAWRQFQDENRGVWYEVDAEVEAEVIEEDYAI